ncbi:response regulator [Cohnella cellulosilytica]|uniref:Response regulator n=1 Tax=Cohnella cellulosilytica TaxID=986710 RepID=A0ABW2FF19_9BACL
MIRVLVVDDEKLVRQGIISSLPWAQFDMQVVGEAKNGEKAIEFLEQNEADLMLTDLAMPMMSGIELMRIVRKRFPQMHMIVLTLHQDFEYIQEALRLGAIDYIAKVELVQDRFHEILARIHARIREEEDQGGRSSLASPAPSTSADPGTIVSDRGYALLILRPGDSDADWPSELYALLPQREEGEGLLFGCPSDESDSQRLLASLTEAARARLDAAVLCLDGLKGAGMPEVKRLLEAYRDRDFFYDYDPSVAVLRKSLRELQEKPADGRDAGLAELSEQWADLAWLNNDERFAALLDKLKRMKLPRNKLTRFLFKLTEEWNAVFGSVLSERLQLPEEFGVWDDVEALFRRIRETMSGTLGAQHYSPEVRDAVTRAVQLIQEGLDGPLHAAEIARRVNMSRSYFSQCFKDIVGKTFNEYVRQARVDKAREYLIHTDKPIAWIAEKTGYLDGKYFSTVFREQTGLLPSAYRKSHRRKPDA